MRRSHWALKIGWSQPTTDSHGLFWPFLKFWCLEFRKTHLMLKAWGIGDKTVSTLPVGWWTQAIQNNLTKKRMKNWSLDKISTKLSIIDLFHSLRISSSAPLSTFGWKNILSTHHCVVRPHDIFRWPNCGFFVGLLFRKNSSSCLTASNTNFT